MTSDGAARRGGWRGPAVAVAVVLACLVPALPLLTVEVPPLSDYPNHLARIWFLARGTADPALSAMLAPNWALLPNLGVDALLAAAMQVLPPHVAGRAMLALILVLPVLGAVALGRATFGRTTAWSLGAALVTCHALFLLGFLNFGLSVGLAMLAGAAWFRFREPHPAATVLGAIVAACALFFCHLAGTLFFLLLAASCEAERVWVARRPWAALGRAVALAVVAAGPLALYAATALQGAGGPTVWAGLAGKGIFALYPVVNYDRWLDAATAGVIVGALVAGLVSGRIVVPVRWRLMILGLLACFVVAPVTVKGLSYVDARFSVMLAFSVFAGVRWVRVPPGLALGMAAVGAALLLGRTGLVGVLWHQYGAEVAAVRAVIAPVEPGARVLPVWGDRTPPGGLSPRVLSDGSVVDWHLPALVLLERKAFWPYVFADPGQQPMRLLGDYAVLAGQTRGLVEPPLLQGGAPSTAELAAFPLWRSWQDRYDYVLLMDPGRTVVPEAMGGGHLVLLQRSGMASLLRVRP